MAAATTNHRGGLPRRGDIRYTRGGGSHYTNQDQQQYRATSQYTASQDHHQYRGPKYNSQDQYRGTQYSSQDSLPDSPYSSQSLDSHTSQGQGKIRVYVKKEQRFYWYRVLNSDMWVHPCAYGYLSLSDVVVS